ncbi:hypothetical protein [Epilithonimonas sp.]|uniref:hypothetical protein n=1 Tax=Epilithonimonas sp. TaxID=2894511 RepID=UPI0028AC65FA|nr:hypothetical protein [Epilithonimonas sp.]
MKISEVCFELRPIKKLKFLVALFICIISQAQLISGTVLSQNDNQPIPYAKIGILNSNFGT